MKVDFIHLRTHTSYSLGKSSLTIQNLVSLTQQYSMPAVAITDNNNLFGAREFSHYLSENGIKPIIGMELTISYHPDSDDTNTANLTPSNKLQTKNHMYSNKGLSDSKNVVGDVVLLARNELGYLNLLKLHKELYNNQDNHNDISLPLATLLQYSSDLILLSGGNEGFLSQVLCLQQPHVTKQVLILLKRSFTDNFYIELNRYPHRSPINLENEYLRLAQEHNVPIVATANPYFCYKEDFEANDILMCIGQGVQVSHYDRHILSEEQYFKTQEEMVQLFKDLPEALENTVKIAQKCNFFVKACMPSLPLYQEGVDEKLILQQQAHAGLEQKLASYISGLQQKQALSESQIADLTTEYNQRLTFELDIIAKMNFAGYFLIVADFINWAKNQNIPVGPGRGSGAGSLVAWALNITDINPLQFGLFFERFLNPERISMPDFDIDFCQQRRDEVIQYVVNKYGTDRVAQIITFGSLQTRGALRDVGRALGLPYASVDKICKRIPYSTPSNPITISKVLQEEKELQKDVERYYMLNYLFDVSLKLENLYKNISTHAAGIVISSKPLVEVVPLYQDSSNSFPVVGFTMKYVEEVGLVKFDFLGLKTLTVIHGTVKRIHDLLGVTININEIPLGGVAKISNLLGSGKTLGIFQLESLGVRDVLVQLKPDKIEDIIAVISLYRPGPIESIPSYINRKHGKEKIQFLHPLMEDILAETFGIMIYQEQVMQIAQKLAGYSLGEADLLRRAMGKKKPEEMAQQQDKFITGARANGIDQKTATLIFELMEKFAGYGFNKSHAAAYALVSWQSAFLKSHYPAEFIAESMTYDMGDSDKIAVLIEDAKDFNIKVLPPDINHTDPTFISFTDSENKLCIRYCILAIKGTSKNLVECVKTELSHKGPFKSMQDFLTRVPSEYLNKKQLEALIKSGSFDSLEPNRGKLLSQVDVLLDFNNNAFKSRVSQQASLFDGFDDISTAKLILKDIDDMSLKDKLAMEANVIGFFISGHPLGGYEDHFEQMGIVKYNELIAQELTNVHLAVVVLKIKSAKTRNNDRYITLSCSDVSSAFNIILFGKSYTSFATKVSEGGMYKIKIAARYDGTEAKLFVEDLQEFDFANLSYDTTKNNNIELNNNIEQPNTNVGLRIRCSADNREVLYKIYETVKNMKQGDIPIYLDIILSDGTTKYLDLGYKVQITKQEENIIKGFVEADFFSL